MNDEVKEILDFLKDDLYMHDGYKSLHYNQCDLLLDYITNLRQENKLKDTNRGSLKFYLEKLYYKGYIEEAISDDIDKKIKELESKVEIKGYQKDIKALQQENGRLKEQNKQLKENNKDAIMYIIGHRPYEDREYLINILQNGSDE